MRLSREMGSNFLSKFRGLPKLRRDSHAPQPPLHTPAPVSHESANHLRAQELRALLAIREELLVIKAAEIGLPLLARRPHVAHIRRADRAPVIEA